MATVVLVVRNVPCKVLEADLREVMQKVGLRVSRYELCFPKKPGRHGRFNNFGYGFVTCCEQGDAEDFARALHGFRFEHINSSKQLVIELERSGQSRALGGLHPMVQVSNDALTYSAFALRQSSFAEPFWSDRMTASGRDASISVADAALWERSIGSLCKQPDAYEVPPTRLASHEGSLQHLMVDATDAWVNDDASRKCFRFQ
eukprot:TRINITY_DN9817_c0_g1_i2.p1 TRINITY_DN9817_c0_g1~~TRINITY_DN9817_c0_g1_i2.p1  ORF type:complete len:217 (+),score=31.31 TRINITY_DN9817_c0_g1_i2:43-651(+)